LRKSNDKYVVYLPEDLTDVRLVTFTGVWKITDEPQADKVDIALLKSERPRVSEK
jgi:hypothetical protein